MQPYIGGLIALGGVFTTQLVNTALENRRVQETRRLEDERADTVNTLRPGPAAARRRRGPGVSVKGRTRSPLEQDGQSLHRAVALAYLGDRGLQQEKEPEPPI